MKIKGKPMEIKGKPWVFIDFSNFVEVFLAQISSFNSCTRQLYRNTVRTSSESRTSCLLWVKCEHQAVILNQTRGR